MTDTPAAPAPAAQPSAAAAPCVHANCKSESALATGSNHGAPSGAHSPPYRVPLTLLLVQLKRWHAWPEGQGAEVVLPKPASTAPVCAGGHSESPAANGEPKFPWQQEGALPVRLEPEPEPEPESEPEPMPE